MGTKQVNDKTTHRQQVKTGFVQKWKMGKQKSRTFPGLFQDFFIFQGLNFFQIFITKRFKVHFFQSEAAKWIGALSFFDSDTGDKNRDYQTNWID